MKEKTDQEGLYELFKSTLYDVLFQAEGERCWDTVLALVIFALAQIEEES